MEIVPGRGRRHRHLTARILVWLAGALSAFVVLAVVVLSTNVWPGALLIRSTFDRGGEQTDKVLQRFAPDPGAVLRTKDVTYRHSDPDGQLDVYTPAGVVGTDTRLPTIVWFHGGGWLAGNKSGTATWARILADKGYTVVVPDYTLAPAAHYPCQLQQVLDALAFLHTDPPDHVDPDQLVLAGDSAGPASPPRRRRS
ncbi:hypothetical protein GCM10025864_26190 [Luteimicrobium album]|uniref:Alpha/beta hydrolase fold-3 domain-containing protein n=1 Tax=Luteimicrobium album TaxID=1054550 RepID=A0ABQ6I2Y3_9MICO|nr:alpha/beta hydrolase [Luteimicrobium album]GMA24860.1 hypothetical protein GCM10025864_26190 [Luteimicrobium album]